MIERLDDIDSVGAIGRNRKHRITGHPAFASTYHQKRFPNTEDAGSTLRNDAGAANLPELRIGKISEVSSWISVPLLAFS
jgi:hypothetical protein